jgi:transposase InsO family protein
MLGSENAICAARCAMEERLRGIFSRLRLNVEEFQDVREDRPLAQAWQREDNHDRPQGAFDYKPPPEFAGC